MQVIGFQIVQLTEHKINITHPYTLDKMDPMPFCPRCESSIEVMTKVLEGGLPSIGLDF